MPNQSLTDTVLDYNSTQLDETVEYIEAIIDKGNNDNRLQIAADCVSYFLSLALEDE